MKSEMQDMTQSLITLNLFFRHLSGHLSFDTITIGCISDGDERAYRKEMTSLTSWCKNSLLLSVGKIKEMILSGRLFRRLQI